MGGKPPYDILDSVGYMVDSPIILPGQYRRTDVSKTDSPTRWSTIYVQSSSVDVAVRGSGWYSPSPGRSRHSTITRTQGLAYDLVTFYPVFWTASLVFRPHVTVI